MNAEQLYHGPELCKFSLTTPIELGSLVKSTAKKSCFLDPIPGSLLTDCFSVLLPVFVNMINLSFKDRSVPALFEEAVLDPVIKKDILDHEIYQNYRPISNLCFVSKATEKGVPSRLTDHLAPVVQVVDSTIHWINHYPLETSINFDNTYPVDSATTGAWRIIICLRFFSQHTRRDTVRRQLLHELMIIYLELSMTMFVSFSFFWTSQWPLTLLTTKYYSHDLSVAAVSKVMLWPGCAHISQIGSNTSEWRTIVHLSTSWPVVKDLC